GCDGELIASPFLGLWSDTTPGVWKRPFVIVNGAGEENGKRILTSPLNLAVSPMSQPGDAPIVDADNFQDRNGGRGVNASTAIHNGARFPWISPAGRLADGGRILDGGSFAPAGVETVRELARKIRT